jgi:hypothetical protein
MRVARPVLYEARNYDWKMSGEKWNERAAKAVEDAIAQIERGEAWPKVRYREFTFEDPLSAAGDFFAYYFANGKSNTGSFGDFFHQNQDIFLGSQDEDPGR